MTAAIILAAGASARLRQPKQNLLFRNKTLLQHAIDTAIAAKCSPVIVVLGSADITIPGDRDEVTVLHNPDWAEGMASSIRIAVKKIIDNAAIASALIMLCDQPFVTPALINNMQLKQQETGNLIGACMYKGTVGVPAIFNCQLFAELLLLQGQEGAKKIINNYPDEVVKIPFEMGGIDIDTPEDYEQLLKRE